LATLGIMHTAHEQGLTYPTTRKVDQVDDYHGTVVADPYRWLEDDNSDETAAWVKSENDVTSAYLSGLPQREPLRRRLTELWNVPRFGAPFRRGSRYFFFKNDGLQNQAVFYCQESLTAEAQVLLDPNTFSSDGTVAISDLSVSDDGSLVAYGVSRSGSDWKELRVREVATGNDLPDLVRWVKFSGITWTKDGKGFFYSRYPEPDRSEVLQKANVNHELYYHRLGDPQEKDVLVYERPDHPTWLVNADITEDGRYAVIYLHESGTDNLLYYIDLGDPLHPDVTAGAHPIVEEWIATNFVVGNDGPKFYVQTKAGAPRGRIVTLDLAHPTMEHWTELIPESRDVIEGTSIVQDRIIVTVLHDAYHQVHFYDLSGRLVKDLDLPTIGSVGGVGGRRQDTELFYVFTSFLYPATVFRYDMESGRSTVFRAPSIDFDPSRYETKQIWYTSKDGTKVPMFVTHRKGIPMDGSNPTLLYGYGGFNISLTPFFSVSNLVWLDNGGIYVIANLRGGGEFGNEWHEGGTRERKQNVFDDFIAAAEYLIAQGYTSPKKLAIQGGSNGGLLVGAVMCQRPELFGVALPAVGVMDMLRYHRFTIGMAWKHDYGISDSLEDFTNLFRYSPLHNLKPGVHYPATLVSTADHDDRVVPAHSFKFAARLQECQGGEAPTLIRIETKAGHGAGKPTSMIIDETADILAFTMANLAM
jgi:prolyl oligopeptidase